MTAVLPPPTGDLAEEIPAPQARADCVADSAGGLTFDFAAEEARGARYLLLRLRTVDPAAGGEVRLPLTPAGDGRLRAVLPSTVTLSEGRWDIYTDPTGHDGDAPDGDATRDRSRGVPRRIVPGVNDLRSLVDRSPTVTRPHVAVRIPYTTKYGNLTVRAWDRAPHAEAGELCVESEALTVHGRLYGTPLTPGAYAEVRDRRDPAGVRRTQVTAQGADFSFSVAYEDVAGTAGTWDLWLLPAGASGPQARVARLLDDVADKKHIFTYPAVRVGDTLVRPYYTKDNDLSLRVG